MIAMLAKLVQRASLKQKLIKDSAQGHVGRVDSYSSISVQMQM